MSEKLDQMTAEITRRERSCTTLEQQLFSVQAQQQRTEA